MFEEILRAVKQGTAYGMVDAVCCEKEERHDIHIDKDKAIPRLLKFECTHGNCGDVELEFGWAFYSCCGV